MPKSSDSSPLVFPGLSGKEDSLLSEIEAVFAYTQQAAQRQIEWYQEKKLPKRRAAWWLRAGAIVFTFVAGVIPVIAQLRPEVKPAWSTVALALAGLCHGFDRFAGCTTGWIRFIQAELELTQQFDAFRFDWAKDTLSLGGKTPTIPQAQARVEKAQAFLIAIHKTVAGETAQWAAEFQAQDTTPGKNG
jgi:hypothetical protein